MATVKKHHEQGWVWTLDEKEAARLEDWCKDLIDAKGYDYDGVDRNQYRRAITGFTAEYIACKHYGTEFEFAITPGTGDGGIDFVSNGVSYAIQSYSYTSKRDLDKRLIIEKKKIDGDNPADVFVSCVVHVPSRKVWIRGQIDLESVRNRSPYGLRPDGLINYVVENRELVEPDLPSAYESVEERVLRDPLCKPNTDKARFFKGDWKAAHPRNWRPYRGVVEE